MSDKDLNVQIGELSKWQQEVEQELQEVDRILDEVAKITKECDEDDTIYGEIGKMGEGIANAYLELAKTFQNTMEETKAFIENLKKRLQNIGEYIKNAAEKFTL